jgi:hypothetical protein
VKGFAKFFAHVCSQDLQTAAQGSEYAHTLCYKQDPFLLLVTSINLKKPYDGPGRLKFFTPSPNACLYSISFKCSVNITKYSACRINIYENF